MGLNLATIAKGWSKYLEGTDETRALMLKRLAVCDRCEYKKQVSQFGAAIIGIFDNSPDNLFKCDRCNCPLGALASVPQPLCREKKWDV